MEVVRNSGICVYLEAQTMRFVSRLDVGHAGFVEIPKVFDLRCWSDGDTNY